MELSSKAKICKTLAIDDFFAFNLTTRKELYKPYKVHDYEELSDIIWVVQRIYFGAGGRCIQGSLVSNQELD